MPVEIRPATPGDAGRLTEIDALVNARPRSAELMEAICRSAAGSPGPGRCSGETALVLELEGQVCGFVAFSRVLDEASIHDIAVHPMRQGRGLGRSLLDAALREMKRDGANRCLLEVRESNGAARGLYRAAHFQPDGVRKNYYPSGSGREDALLMSRQL